MKWSDRILEPVDFGFRGTEVVSGAFADRLDSLIEHQIGSWSDLRDGIAAWQRLQYRTVAVKDSQIQLQHNPGRIVSTTARIDAASVKERPCFLCPENMPLEERGLAFGADFVVLCNPFPVLERHLVLVAKEHVPQCISGSLERLLELAQALGPEFVLVYNGPRCGASAPDHLHFQAGLASALPIFGELSRRPRLLLSEGQDLQLFADDGFRVRYLTLLSTDKQKLAASLEKIVQALHELSGPTNDEPMINLLARRLESKWELLVFPRARHRPSAFFAEGEARLTVSPAAIDLGGLLVVPERAHFEKLDSASVEGIYSEVTLAAAVFGRLIEILSRRSGG